jgi:hypothetical protein
MTRLGAVLLGVFSSILAAQPRVAVIRSTPWPSVQEIADLEARVLQNPDDLDAERDLLQLYLNIAPPAGHQDPGRESVRLQHIIFLVQHHPDAAVSGSKAAYVGRASGSYANPSDHNAVRSEWLAAVESHPKKEAVTINAVRFLEVEDADDAERLLRRAIDAETENRKLAANLGFLYALEIVGSNGGSHAEADLEQNSNAIVLAAAATALPNLAVKMSGGRVVDPKVFDFASELAARARQLAPNDVDVQGPMPFIQYFVPVEQAALARH